MGYFYPTVLLIGGPKNGESLVVDPSYVEKQFPIEFKEADSDEFFNAPLTVKTSFYNYTGLKLKDDYVYAIADMHPAMVKFELIKLQLQSFGIHDQVNFFGVTFEEAEHIKQMTGFTINIEPPKPKFIPGENCLFA